MFGFGRKHKSDDQYALEFAEHIRTNGLRIDNLIGDQLAFGIKHFGIEPSQVFSGDAFTPHYIFGAYDSMLVDFPLSVRVKLAESIVGMGFIQCATGVFGLSQAEAEKAFQETFAWHNRHFEYPPKVQGGIDGVQSKLGRPALRLLAHLHDVREQ